MRAGISTTDCQSILATSFSPSLQSINENEIITKPYSYFISYAEHLNLIMASATSNTAAALSQNLTRSNFGKAQGATWESVKPDAIELYERMALADMIIRIEMMWGFKRSIAQWKVKIKEWGCIKNIPRKARECAVSLKKKGKLEESRGSEVFPKGNQVMGEKSENSKRRKTGESSYMKTGDEFFPNLLLPLSLESNISIPSDGSIQSLDLGSQSHSTIISSQRDVELISMLDYYLADEDQSWNNLGRQPAEHGAKLSKIIYVEYLTFSTGLHWSGWSDIYFLSEQNLLPDFGGIGAQFVEDPKILALASALAEVEDKCRILARETLHAAQFLAIALQDTARYGEAEYYFRRILSKETRIMVQFRLGMILASCFSLRVKEATSLLLFAVTDFIDNFCRRLPEDNIYILTQMEYLFDDILQHGVLDESVLRPRMFQILTIVRRANSEETRNKLFSPLLIQGLYLANECSVPGLVNSARYLYKVLFQNSPNLDINLYGTRIAIARQLYGQLLRRERKWARSAEQLLLACEMAINLRTDNRRQFDLLKSDCIELLPHLDNSPGKEGSLATSLTYMISHGLHQNTFDLQDSLDARQLFPVQQTKFEAADLSYITTLDLSSTASRSEYRDRNTVSTGSISWDSRSSNKFGETLTRSEFNGMDYLEDLSA